MIFCVGTLITSPVRKKPSQSVVSPVLPLERNDATDDAVALSAAAGSVLRKQSKFFCCWERLQNYSGCWGVRFESGIVWRRSWRRRRRRKRRYERRREAEEKEESFQGAQAEKRKGEKRRRKKKSKFAGFAVYMWEVFAETFKQIETLWMIGCFTLFA